MSKDDGGPAFARPFSKNGEYSDSQQNRSQDGMSLRDYFAAKVVAAAICGGMADGATLNRDSIAQAVSAAYIAADEMLAARSA